MGLLLSVLLSTEILHILNLLIVLEPEWCEAATCHVNEDMKKAHFYLRNSWLVCTYTSGKSIHHMYPSDFTLHRRSKKRITFPITHHITLKLDLDLVHYYPKDEDSTLQFLQYLKSNQLSLLGWFLIQYSCMCII